MADNSALFKVLDKEIITEPELFEVYGPVVFHPDGEGLDLDNFTISADLTQKEITYDLEVLERGTGFTTAGYTLKLTRVTGVILDPITLKNLRDAATKNTQATYQVENLDRSGLSGDQIVATAKEALQARANLVHLLTRALTKNHIENIVEYRVESAN